VILAMRLADARQGQWAEAFPAEITAFPIGLQDLDAALLGDAVNVATVVSCRSSIEIIGPPLYLAQHLA
jgi:hypothetical protein